jgi:hypothetical protein
MFADNQGAILTRNIINRGLEMAVERGSSVWTGDVALYYPKYVKAYLILPAALGPGVHSPLTEMSTGSRKIMFLGGRKRPMRRSDNLTVICVPIA